MNLKSPIKYVRSPGTKAVEKAYFQGSGLDLKVQRKLRQMPTLLAKAASIAAHFTGLSRAVAIRYRGCGTIFALHSVVDDDSSYIDPLRLPVRKLERILGWLKKQGADVISLDEVVERLSTPSIHPFAVFCDS